MIFERIEIARSPAIKNSCAHYSKKEMKRMMCGSMTSKQKGSFHVYRLHDDGHSLLFFQALQAYAFHERSRVKSRALYSSIPGQAAMNPLYRTHSIIH